MGVTRQTVQGRPLARLLLLVFAVGVLSAGCHRPPEGTPTPRPTAASAMQEVDGAKAVRRKMPQRLDLIGTISADATTSLGPEVAGKVTEVPVVLGSTLGVGQVVLRLDTSQILVQMRMAEAKLAQAQASLRQAQAQLKQSQASLLESEAALGMTNGRLKSRTSVPAVQKAKAILDNARSNLKRYQELRNENLVSDQDVANAQKDALTAAADYQAALEAVDKSLAGLKGAQANIQASAATVASSEAALVESQAQVLQYEQQVRKCTVVSPLNGFVQQVNVSVGDYVQVGAAAVVAVKTSPLYVAVDVPETVSHTLRVGQRVSLQPDARSGKEIGCTVSQISPVIDPRSRTVRIKAVLTQSGYAIRPGMFARVVLYTGAESTSLTVPQSALLPEGQEARVFRLSREEDGWVAHAVDVKKGQTTGAWVEVTGNLADGQTVAASNLGALKDGLRVKVNLVPDPPFPGSAR